jgi:23S rRNA (cytosine1962-C5)-methyltransferase
MTDSSDLVLRAIGRRARIVARGDTNALRLIHGSSDGIPGIFVDRLGDALLVSWRDRFDPALVEVLTRGTGLVTVYQRRLLREVRVTPSGRAAPGHLAGPKVAGRFPVCENGLTYLVSFEEGYSTGLFLDQRETRVRVASGEWIADRARTPEILNAFAYTGAFSVCGAAAGARVTSLDLSRRYLDWARDNLTANRFDPKAHEFLVGDAFDWFRRLARKGRRFDLVIVDPPTFSTSKRTGTFSALRDYGRLARAALSLVAPNGHLLACTNALRIEPRSFRETLAEACRGSGRSVASETVVGQPLDFASGAEPAHLKIWWARLA